MKKLIIAMALLAMNPSAFAFNSDGIDEAFNFCSQISFSSERDQCAEYVRNAEYFMVEAIEVCKGISFSDKKAQCIGVIADKVYRQSELSFCSKKSFSDDKVSCLAEGGKAHGGQRGCADYEQILDQISRAIGQIEDGRPYSAQRTLTRLEGRVSRCVQDRRY